MTVQVRNLPCKTHLGKMTLKTNICRFYTSFLVIYQPTYMPDWTVTPALLDQNYIYSWTLLLWIQNFKSLPQLVCSHSATAALKGLCAGLDNSCHFSSFQKVWMWLLSRFCAGPSSSSTLNSFPLWTSLLCVWRLCLVETGKALHQTIVFVSQRTNNTLC